MLTGAGKVFYFYFIITRDSGTSAARIARGVELKVMPAYVQDKCGYFI